MTGFPLWALLTLGFPLREAYGLTMFLTKDNLGLGSLCPLVA